MTPATFSASQLSLHISIIITVEMCAYLPASGVDFHLHHLRQVLTSTFTIYTTNSFSTDTLLFAKRIRMGGEQKKTEKISFIYSARNIKA